MGGGGTIAGSGGRTAASGPVAERRLVTVLFADLVGFTSMSEGRDPEEVRELLSRYFDVAREQIERYAGTVEKFIGDAVMAVWGAPTAHEDDAERGVRAALEVVDAVKGLFPGLQARAGVLTGEAAVTVGARGQGMVAGDLVNTASRLQSAAQPGMVLVGESTQRVTSGSIAYEPAGEQLLKGKEAPVIAYHALRVVARRRGAGRGDRLEPPFVGRDSELRLLKDLFHTTSRERRVRLVSVTGQAGVGKSRLAWELRKYSDGVAEDIFWHEGRSPAYGQGITFWALGEMVRARAQLLETDDPATTREKLDDSVTRWFPSGEEHDRVLRALGALLGVADGPVGGAQELFGAWRLYFERMAEQYLVTMIFEDLHWADPGTLDFVDHLLEWSRNVPILIVTLARPELLEIRPDWGAGRRNFLALDLEPLAEAPMRELLKGLVPALSESAVRSIVARAEGIPLYAVETIRMLAADGRLRELPDGGFEPVGEVGELAVPDSLHALIAARLDALEAADRTLVQDAAVLGQSFTPAGLAAVSGLDAATLVTRLRELVKADLLTEERDERSPERGQFAFVQALIREVAYSTLSLRDRGRRHLAAARFFESFGDDELAGALAAHYLAAFRATTDPDEAAPLGTQARLALRGAAERAAALGSVRQAIAFLVQALDVATEDQERADLLERIVQAAQAAGEYASALELAPELRRSRTRWATGPGPRWPTRSSPRRCTRRASGTRPSRWPTEALKAFEDMPDDPSVLRHRGQPRDRCRVHSGLRPRPRDVGRALAGAERLGHARGRGPDADDQGLGGAVPGPPLGGHGADGGRAAPGGAARPDDDVKPGQRSPRQHPGARRPPGDGRGGARDRRVRAADRPTRAETVTIGNMAEDIRRTGDWDWIVGELERAIRDEDRNVNDLLLESALVEFRQLRGEVGARGDRGNLGASSPSSRTSTSRRRRTGSRRRSRSLAGDYAEAAAGWIRQADGSDLNAPYALPKAGHAAILAKDATLAQQILDRLAALGRGAGRSRPTSTGSAPASPGCAATGGGARRLPRRAHARSTTSGWTWDLASLALPAATVLGTDEPEIAEWLAEARTTFQRLRAKPMLALLDALSEAAPAKGRAASPPRDGAGEGAKAQAEASSSST